MQPQTVRAVYYDLINMIKAYVLTINKDYYMLATEGGFSERNRLIFTD